MSHSSLEIYYKVMFDMKLAGFNVFEYEDLIPFEVDLLRTLNHAHIERMEEARLQANLRQQKLSEMGYG